MKKILAFALVLALAFYSFASAATYYPRSNNAQRYGFGGQVLVSSLAQVWVYTSGTTSLATIYSNSTGSTLSNPLTTDQYGNYIYYAAPGFYDETVVGPAGTSPISIYNTAIGPSASLNISNYTNIAAADSAAIAAGKGLICANTYTISTAMTITSPVEAKPGCSFVKSGSGTITLNGPFSAGLYQVFSGFSAGNVTFGPGSVDRTYSIWGAGLTDNRNLVSVDGIQAWGHSYVTGVIAPSGPASKGFPSLLSEDLGLYLRNYAIGGTSLFYTPNADSAWPSILQNVTRPQNHFVSSHSLFLSMYGINDINKLGNDGPSLEPFKSVQRVAIARWRAGAIFEDSDSSVSYGSGWTLFANTTHNSGAGYHYNPTAGGTITITTPADFPGGTMDIGFSSRTSNGAIITSNSINGNIYTIDTRNNRSDSNLAYVLRIPNVAAGSASYTFTTSSPQGPWGAMFDYWQWEPATDDAPYVVLIKQPKPLDYTAYGSVPPGPPTDAGVDALNKIFDDLAAEFDNHVLTVDTSSIDHNTAVFIASNVHPTVYGHLIIEQLIKAIILSTFYPSEKKQSIASRIEYGTAAPATTYVSYQVGDQVINSAPAEVGSGGSKYVITGWICTVAGAPGTWLPMRALTGN